MSDVCPGLDPAPSAKNAQAYPLREACLVFAAFWLPAYLPAASTSPLAEFGDPRYTLTLLLELVPRALLLAYIMDRAEGLSAFGIGRLRAHDAMRALLTAAAGIGIIALMSLAGSLAGAPMHNPLLSSLARPPFPLPLALVALALSALAVGYGEELFFRVYLMRRLKQAGLPPPWALAVSSLLFGGAHGLQGLAGLFGASLLGAWFAYRWEKGRNFHEIALGHALYDLCVLTAALYMGA